MQTEKEYIDNKFERVTSRDHGKFSVGQYLFDVSLSVSFRQHSIFGATLA